MIQAKPQTLLEVALKNMKVVDLTHSLKEGMPFWPTHAKYELRVIDSHKKGDISCHNEVTFGDHTGTHVDAPVHFIPEGSPASRGIEAISLDVFHGRALTIDGTHLGKNALFTLEMIQSWEEQYGLIHEGDVVLFYFGWDQLWEEQPESFLTDWPGISGEVADYLVGKRVKMVGSDALSLDNAASTEFPAHYKLLGNEVLIMENLKNVGTLPPFSYFFGFPLKMEGASASPIRAVAFVSNEESQCQ
jgi:kynurenine formamidase